jgi:hypothetical protein
MNYLDLIEDILILIISKIENKDDIISFQSSNIEINELLTKSNTWRILIRMNYPNVYNVLHNELSLEKLRLIYELSLLDKLFGVSYIKNMDINFNSVGYKNKNMITKDIIYNAYLKIRESNDKILTGYLFRNQMYQTDSINIILESFIDIYLLETKNIENTEIYPDFDIFSLLIQAYQLNYDLYMKLVLFCKNNLTAKALQNITNPNQPMVRRPTSRVDPYPNIYTDPFYINKDKQLVISDLKSRWNI